MDPKYFRPITSPWQFNVIFLPNVSSIGLDVLEDFRYTLNKHTDIDTSSYFKGTLHEI